MSSGSGHNGLMSGTPAPVRGRVRAPELDGSLADPNGWWNTGGQAMTLAGLRGRFVLLDFWTFCCVNCLHTLAELRPFEERYAEHLTVIGVHSPKFEHEADRSALGAAVERYAIAHPVVDDAQLFTWRQYAVRAWPTLALVDPEGYVIAQLSGEGHAHHLAALLDQLLPVYAERGSLGAAHAAPTPSALAASPLTASALADSALTDSALAAPALHFPSKVTVLPGGDLLVSDTASHRLVRLAADAETVLAVIGRGQPGLVDGGADQACFNEPGGTCLLPTAVAEQLGYDVVVADTVNHVLRGVRLADGQVTTVAGKGTQRAHGDPRRGPALTVPLSSPWDLAWYDGAVAIAMAGTHTVERFDAIADTLSPLAGTTNEGLVDGLAEQAWFAQTSGLAVSEPVSENAAGQNSITESLWLVDAETSALRLLIGGQVRTAIGKGLFDFGHRDGPAEQALLQHPLGLALLPDGSVVIADTYNGALRRYDPITAQVTTLASGLAEPTDVAVVPDPADPQRPALVVVESTAHRLTLVRLPEVAAGVVGPAQRTARPVLEVPAGPVRLRVVFTPPPGQILDDRYGPPTRLLVSATPPEALVTGAGIGPELERALELHAPHDGNVVLHVQAMAASCDGEQGLCHMHQQDWGVQLSIGAPKAVVPDISDQHEIVLLLAGIPG